MFKRPALGAGSSPAINACSRSGVIGSAMSLAPSASAIALAMQAGVLMQLPSAMPLAPSGVSGEGVSWCRISSFGISLTVGTR